MSLKRFSIAMASGVVLGLLLGSGLLADAAETQERDADARPDIYRPPPGPPPGPQLGEQRPPGPRQGPGPGRPGGPRPRYDLQPQPRGPTPGGPPNGPGFGMGPGPPDRLGPPDRPGPPEQAPRGRHGFQGDRPRWPHNDWDAFQKNDPQMYKLLMGERDLERQTRELAVQYRRAPAAQRTAIKEKLKELVGKHFEIRQQRRILELKRLEEELKRLRDAIDLRNKARERLVEERTAQLLGEDKGLEF